MKKRLHLKKRSVYTIGLCAIAIFLITLIVYTPALKNDFVWDDSQYISENTLIRSLGVNSLYGMLTSFHASNWHPLTWFSHAIDYAFWGLNPLGHHLTNIIFHGLNTLLVFLLVIQLTQRAKEFRGTSLASKMTLPISTKSIIGAVITALLFGLHPLHVESVAWASERKDLLCALFVIFSILSYLSYTSSVVERHRWIWFNTCLLLFAFALMSKPMAVTLPVILLLLDIYPLRRISLCPGKGARKLSVFLEKIPFFALSIVSSIITIMAQHSGGAIQSLERMPLDFRMLNGLNSLVFYLEKMVWPHELVPFYPLPKYFYPFDLQYIIPGILVLSVTGICLWMVKKGKYLLFIVWLYYVITLIPVLGIIQVGDQVAADRYTYLPGLGVFILIGAGVSWIFEKGILFKHKSIIGGLGLTFICIFIFLGQLTVKQIKLWHNSETLWSYVISAFPFPKSGPIAHYNLANAYAEKGWLDEAISAYKRALTINPNNVKAHNNLGLVHYRKGMFDDAISEYKKALVISPDLIELRCNIGLAYDKKGWLDEAISEYMRALIINPNDAKAHYNLGLTYHKKGMLFEAISEWKKVITINPNHLKAHYKLGQIYGNKGMFKEAIFHFKQVIAINPNYAVVYNNLAWIYATCQNTTFRNGEEAVSLATKACELTKFNNVSLLNTLAAAYAEVGNFKKAIEYQNRVIDLSQKEARPAMLKRLERYQSGQVYSSQ